MRKRTCLFPNHWDIAPHHRDPGCYPGSCQTTAGHCRYSSLLLNSFSLLPLLVFLVTQGLWVAQNYLKSSNIISSSEMFSSLHWMQEATWQSCRTVIPIKAGAPNCERNPLLSRVTWPLERGTCSNTQFWVMPLLLISSFN